MLENIKYINHINEVIDFSKNGIYANANDLHDFAWGINSKNDKISSFKKGITKKALPVVIKGNTEEECNTIKNDIFEITEKDVIAVKPGRLIFGDYYMKCYITESKITDYRRAKNYCKNSLVVYTDHPWWIKETSFSFGTVNVEGKNLDYNHDYDYDFTTNILNAQLINPDFVASNFRLRIFGPAVNPIVTIGNHEYQVNAVIGSNEYLTIDSIEKTILLTDVEGNIQNCFNLRNKDSYIFKKIPSGISNVGVSGEFNFEITLFEERGVPKWI